MAMLRDNIQYNFLQDGHFAELKESEMLMERLRLLRFNERLCW